MLDLSALKRQLFFLVIFTGSTVLQSCKSSRSIIQKPIVFDDSRKEMTLDYLSTRYGLEKDVPTIDPNIIVLHWTFIETLEDSFEAFENSLLPNFRSELKDAGALNVSSHFLVDRDGAIYQLMPETLMARHVIGLNHSAIGIENVGGTENTPLTKKQVKANIWLVKYLAEKYNIEYLIGHSEYTQFEGTSLWLEKDDGYRTLKNDPGDDFLRAVRKGTNQFKFKKAPEKKL